ncbi:MAG: hypothetical protein Q7J69_06600 [Candidatus Omnitrophota bacterium]|nr:hypothetical protein [Candidatus Omnitrophota bacterium]
MKTGLFFLLTAFCLLPSVFAVEVEPTRLELKIAPGQPVSGELQIANKGVKPVEVRLSTGPYRFLDPKLKLPSCQDWFRFEPARLTLAAGAATAVAYTVTPPKNLDVDTAGEYLGAILVDQYPADQPDTAPAAGKKTSAKLTIVPRLALAVYMMVEGKERVEVKVGKLTAEKLASEGGGIGGRAAAPDLLKMTVALKNLGTVHVRPSGAYALFQEDGHLYHAAPLGKSMPLLPTGSMTVPSLLPLPPAGRYRWVLTVEVKEGTVLQEESSFEVTPEGDVVQKEKKG